MNAYCFNSNIEKYKFRDKVIFSNKNNGKWIRMGDDIAGVIESIVESKNSFDEIELFDNEDKKTLSDVLENLKDMEILTTQREEEFNSTISFELTSNCNLKCVHCCVDAGCSRNNELCYEEWIEAFDKAINWRPRSIMLSGGEPMIRQDFFRLLRYLRENYDGLIVLSTNGTLIKESNIMELVLLVDEIDISLDGYDENSCALIRGQGVFDRVMSSIKMLHDQDFYNIVLSMAIGSKNAAWEREFIALNKKLKTKPMVRLFSPVGRGKKSKSVFLEDGDNDIYIPKDFLMKKDGVFNVSCCSAGDKELFVSSIGNIYPCPSFYNERCILGNVLDIRDIDEITINHCSKEIIKDSFKRKNINGDRCLDCPVRDFCWTCPGCINEVESQEALNNYCKVMYDFLMKRIWEE